MFGGRGEEKSGRVGNPEIKWYDHGGRTVTEQMREPQQYSDKKQVL